MKKQRGMVLVTSMQMSAVMLMFIGAAMALGPGSGSAAQAILYQGQSERAAESGVSYALAQLRHDPNWKGNRNRITVNLPGQLFVEEDNGNVIGLVSAGNGQWSQFRLRFNYQDGPGTDGLADPTKFRMDLNKVSFNNLFGGVVAPVPTVTGGTAQAGSRDHDCPVWAVSLTVEGISGPGTGPLSPTSPNAAFTGPVFRRMVHGLYHIPNMGPGIEEAGSMSGNDFKVELSKDAGSAVTVGTKDNTRTPRVRTKGKIEVKNGEAGKDNYISPKGEVKSNSGKFDSGDPDSTVTLGTEDKADAFYQLAWSDVKQADPTSAPKAPGGTYVWWEDGTLHYYDMGYDDYVKFIGKDPNNPGVDAKTVLPTAVVPEDVALVDPKTGNPVIDPATGQQKKIKTLTIKDSIYVEPKTSKEFNVIPRQGAPLLPPDDPEAPSSGTGAASQAAAFLANPVNSVVTNTFLAAVVPSGSGEIDIQSSSGQDIMEISWGGGGVQFESQSGGYTIVDFYQALWLSQTPGGMPNGYKFQSGKAPNTFDPSAWATNLGLPGVGSPDEIPGVADKLTAADLAVNFNPPTGSTAVLTGESGIRLTGSVQGKGGSIVAGGDIRITGLGAKLSAGDSPEDAVNMYSKGNILFSSMDKDENGNYTFADVNLKGVIYAQGDFKAYMGSGGKGVTTPWARFNLDGMLIAYGGDPATDAPGKKGGKVEIRAKSATFLFDPVCVAAVAAKLPADFKLTPLSWTNKL